MTLRRDRRRKKKKSPNMANFGAGPCPNCGLKEFHFVPPSLGDPGFFICQREGGFSWNR